MNSQIISQIFQAFIQFLLQVEQIFTPRIPYYKESLIDFDDEEKQTNDSLYNSCINIQVEGYQKISDYLKEHKEID